MIKRAQKSFSPKPESLEFVRLIKVHDSAAEARRHRRLMFLFGVGVAFIFGLMIGRLV